MFPAPVSSLLYTLGSANGEQMQGNGRPCQLHADKQPTTSLCYAPTSGLRSCRNMSDILRGLPFKISPYSTNPYPKRSMKDIFHLCLQSSSKCVCVCKNKREHSETGEREREREETCLVKPPRITDEKLVVWLLVMS